MADLLKISQDAQKVVAFSQLGIETAAKLELDTITYTVRDKDGNSIQDYVGRDNQATAYARVKVENINNPDKAPHYVTQASNLSVDSEGNLDFEIGSKVGILFPTEEIKLATESLRNSVDCEAIQQTITDELTALTDLLIAKIANISSCTARSGLMSLPSNPLKILSWAKKFVALYLGPQILALIDLALQLIQFINAVANMTAAAQAAQDNLKLCLESTKGVVTNLAIAKATEALDTAIPQLDEILTTIGEVQTELEGITGTPALVNVSGGTDTFVASIFLQNDDGSYDYSEPKPEFVQAKSNFSKDINSYVDGPDEEQSLDFTLSGGVTGTATTDAEGNLTMTTTVATQTVTVLDGSGNPIDIEIPA